MRQIRLLGVLLLLAACGDKQTAVPKTPSLELIEEHSAGVAEKFDLGIWVWRYDLPQPCVATVHLDIYERGATEPVRFRHTSGLAPGEGRFSFGFREPDDQPERDAFFGWTNVQPVGDGAEDVHPHQRTAGEGDPVPMQAKFGYHVSVSTFGVTQSWIDPFGQALTATMTGRPELRLGEDLPLLQFNWGAEAEVTWDARKQAAKCDRVYQLTIRFDPR